MLKADGNTINQAARATVAGTENSECGTLSFDMLDVAQFRVKRAPKYLPVFAEIPNGAELRPCPTPREYWVIDRTRCDFVDGSINAVDFGGDDEFIATTQMHRGAVAFLNWEDGLDESGLKPEFVGQHLRGRVIGLYREAA